MIVEERPEVTPEESNFLKNISFLSWILLRKQNIIKYIKLIGVLLIEAALMDKSLNLLKSGLR